MGKNQKVHNIEKLYRYLFYMSMSVKSEQVHQNQLCKLLSLVTYNQLMELLKSTHKC
jgi:hypothetical protein